MLGNQEEERSVHFQGRKISKGMLIFVVADIWNCYNMDMKKANWNLWRKDKMDRPITTLFMLMSVDGKISTGATDDLDVDKDFPKIKGVNEGLHQYYEIEQTTDLWSFNSGRVQEKMGVNKKKIPRKTPVSFVVINANDCVLRGKIEGINDLVDFECEDIKGIEKEFRAAVDDYLEFCKEVGKNPEKEYKGTFNVRIDPELHKKLANEASKSGDSLNSCVEKAIEMFVSNGNEMGEYLRNNLPVLIEGMKNESTYKYDRKLIDMNNNIFSFFKNDEVKIDKEIINS